MQKWRYYKTKKIVYAGLIVSPYQLGQFAFIKRHIYKRGNKYLRKTVYEVMKAIKSSCKDDNKFLRMYCGIVKKSKKN